MHHLKNLKYKLFSLNKEIWFYLNTKTTKDWGEIYIYKQWIKHLNFILFKSKRKACQDQTQMILSCTSKPLSYWDLKVSTKILQSKN